MNYHSTLKDEVFQYFVSELVCLIIQENNTYEDGAKLFLSFWLIICKGTHTLFFPFFNVQLLFPENIVLKKITNKIHFNYIKAYFSLELLWFGC